MQEEGTQGSSSTAAVLDYATPTAAATAAAKRHSENSDGDDDESTIYSLRREYDGRHELNSGDDSVPNPEMERVLIFDFIALDRQQMCGVGVIRFLL